MNLRLVIGKPPLPIPNNLTTIPWRYLTVNFNVQVSLALTAGLENKANEGLVVPPALLASLVNLVRQDAQAREVRPDLPDRPESVERQVAPDRQEPPVHKERVVPVVPADLLVAPDPTDGPVNKDLLVLVENADRLERGDNPDQLDPLEAMVSRIHNSPCRFQ